jgi:lipoate-protein ligase A
VSQGGGAAHGFKEPRPDLVQPNPGGPDDPLGESVAASDTEWLRIFEPRDVRLVIGRHQDPERELDTAAAAADGVPIHRRICGGGAVVLAPGMLVVAVRLARDHLGTTSYLERVNRALAPALATSAGVAPLSQGLGDLAMPGPHGAEPRKILGASLRQSGGMALYLGCLLVADSVPLMERYLRPPTRTPAYRASRGHRDFCIHLGQWGVAVAPLRAALEASCRELLRAHAQLPTA